MIWLITVTGCQEHSPQEKVQATPTVSEESAKESGLSFNEVKEKVGEAVAVTKDYIFQESQHYQKKMEEKLEEIDTQIEEWRPKIEEAEKDVRARLEKELAELENKRDDVQKQLEALKEPTQEAWEEMKSGMDKAIQELESALEKAAERFKD
jgi:peptidoglycan hydrolase CwlO-like protein